VQKTLLSLTQENVVNLYSWVDSLNTRDDCR